MDVRAAGGAVLRHVGCDVVLVSDGGVSVSEDWRWLPEDGSWSDELDSEN